MESHQLRAGPRGMSALELIIVIVMIGVLSAVAYPKLRYATTSAGVRGAMGAITTLHSVARNAAVLRGRVSVLVLKGSTSQAMVILKNAGTTRVDTVGKVEDLNARFGVTLRSTSDSVIFTPRGIGANPSNITVIATRATYADTLVISVAGRLLQ